MSNIIKELEKIDQEKGVCYLEDVKELISSARERLELKSYCSMGHLVSHECTEDKDCDHVVRLEDINEVLGDGK